MFLKVCRVLFALMFAASGVLHFVNPANFVPLMPDFLPAHVPLIYISGGTELLAAIGLFIPRLRFFASLGILAMLVVFLPLHVLDVVKPEPVMGSFVGAIVRLVLQFGFIAAAFFLWRHDARTRP